MEAIQWLLTGSFVVLALMGAWLWRVSRSEATVWLSLLFLCLGGARTAIHLLPEERAGLAAALGVVATAALATFPYLLFRFVDSFQPIQRRWRAIADVAGGAILLAAVIALTAQEVASIDPSWYRAYVFAVLGLWTAATAWAVWRLGSAGRREPTLARRRMWTMGVAVALLNAALWLSALGTSEEVVAGAQVAAIASAVTFVLAFSPPSFLRAVWRQEDERALWQAQGALVAAETRDDVVGAVLPHIARLLGGRGALFIDAVTGRDTVTTLEDRDTVSAARLRQQAARAAGERGVASLEGAVACLVLRQGRLAVATSAYVPLFGRDELALLERLGALLDLALSRTEAALTTRVLAAFERGLVPRVQPPAGLTVDSRYRPGVERLQLGGDFMDVITLPDGAGAFIIGDVSGHGPEEAAFAVGVHAGWRTLAKANPANPAAWLALLDETFFDDHPERVVTALTGRIELDSRTMTLASAGHCPPLVVGQSAHLLNSSSDPLLGVGYPNQRKEASVTIDAGQGLLAYTDGLIEQPKPDQPGRRWSEEELLSWLTGQRLADIDLDALLWRFGRDAFDDDVAVMVLRFDER